MNENWIKVFNGVGYPMPEEDCEIWIARGNCFGDGWIQKVDYYVDKGYIEWDGTYAYQKVEKEKAPEQFTMIFAGNKKVICELIK
jgi:hypothetical protein